MPPALSDRLDPAGRVALVTGANRGLGLGVARQLAEAGMTVFLTARDAEKGGTAASALREEGLAVRFLSLDVTDAAAPARIARQVEVQTGRLDVLVHNAAAFADWSETASSADLEAVERMLQVNLVGPWRLTQALLPLLKRSDAGRIVFVTSGAASHGETAWGLSANGGAAASYGVSKAALNALAVKWAAELADTPILVNAVDPGLTDTAPGMADMGARPVAESAPGVVWAATLPAHGASGGFFRDGGPIPW
jgi:NAD(P)-dependent dehydrogenase (short-subunit alcohol dehydrogenase family)